jgi:hypothetical protein
MSLSADSTAASAAPHVDPFRTPPGSPRAGGAPPVVFYTPPSKTPRRELPETPGSAEKPRISPRARSVRQLLRPSPDQGRPVLGEGAHYLRLNPGMALLVDDRMQAPTIFQPTPEGLRLLIANLKQQVSVDLRVHEKSAHTSDRRPDRVRDFLDHADLSALSESHPIGVILTDGQNHAIPIMLARHQDKNYLLVFDSTSGAVIRGYYELADHYQAFQVRVNVGTRQADSQSCITDSFEILKHALQLPDMCAQIESRLTDDKQQQRNPQSRPAHVKIVVACFIQRMRANYSVPHWLARLHPALD